MKQTLSKLAIIFLAGIFCLTASQVWAANYTGKPIKAKLASEELEGDFMTVWARNFSDHMKKWSDDKIDINVYPYGTLGALGDINELAQMGVVRILRLCLDLCLCSPGPGFGPQLHLSHRRRS